MEGKSATSGAHSSGFGSSMADLDAAGLEAAISCVCGHS